MSEEKKYITIILDSGEEKKAELVYNINIKGYGDYIIYLLDDEMYGAKYENDGDGTKLITDLSDEEKDLLNKAFESMVNENVEVWFKS